MKTGKEFTFSLGKILPTEGKISKIWHYLAIFAGKIGVSLEKIKKNAERRIFFWTN